MRWTMLEDWPMEDLRCDPDFNWAIHPQFCQWEDGEEAPELLWSINVLHRHSDNEMFYCGIINRDDKGVFPEYQCDKCGKDVPKDVVLEKVERRVSLKGVDPRNNRRGAVLATRNSNLTDTKES